MRRRELYCLEVVLFSKRVWSKLFLRWGLKSTESDATDKATENEQFKMEYKAELDESMKRKRSYQDNTFKAYALLWE